MVLATMNHPTLKLPHIGHAPYATTATQQQCLTSLQLQPQCVEHLQSNFFESTIAGIYRFTYRGSPKCAVQCVISAITHTWCDNDHIIVIFEEERRSRLLGGTVLIHFAYSITCVFQMSLHSTRSGFISYSYARLKCK